MKTMEEIKTKILKDACYSECDLSKDLFNYLMEKEKTDRLQPEQPDISKEILRKLDIAVKGGVGLYLAPDEVQYLNDFVKFYIDREVKE